jgi:hypothetical protein
MNFNTLHEAASVISDQVGSKPATVGRTATLNEFNSHDTYSETATVGQTKLFKEFTSHDIDNKTANDFIDILAGMSNNQKSKRGLKPTKQLLIKAYYIIKINNILVKRYDNQKSKHSLEQLLIAFINAINNQKSKHSLEQLLIAFINALAKMYDDEKSKQLLIAVHNLIKENA